MTTVESTGRSAGIREVVGRIEGWLLRSGIQIDEGAHRGGIAGWLDPDGRPEFLYLETAGYYLTAMAWLSSGAACLPDHADTARLRARWAARWVATLLEGQDVPPTRLYLSERPADWRNDAVFSFDLAMAARGVAATPDVAGRRERRWVLAGLCTMIEQISSGADVMMSHETLDGRATLPDRWSTRAGPHHLKAAAALLRLPERIVGQTLIGIAHRSCEHWARSMWIERWPCQELHPLLCALEGMLMRSGGRDGDGLRVVERLFVRLMELQEPDGTVSETIYGGIVRSDVLAQALRVGMLLRGREYLTGPVWADRLGGLAEALLNFVCPDGSVMFARDQAISNTWCALFAHQALYLCARRDASRPVPASAFDLLV